MALNCNSRSSLTEHNDWFDGEEEETDVEPRETEYEDDMTVKLKKKIENRKNYNKKDRVRGRYDGEIKKELKIEKI